MVSRMSGFIYNSPDYITQILHPYPASRFTYPSSVLLPDDYITLDFINLEMERSTNVDESRELKHTGVNHA